MAAALSGLVASAPWRLTVARAGGKTFRADTISVDQIHPGMKGYGLTVFEGTKPERFDVEVIDVLRNFRPRQDAILIKTKHPRLDIVNVVRGMSGSPIYLNGKMAGAYAYGWSFGKEPVAGVTPIQNMIEDLERPLPESIFGWRLGLRPHRSSSAGRLQATRTGGDNPKPARFAYSGDLSEYQLDQHAQQLATRAVQHRNQPGELVPVSTPIVVGGMGDVALSMARGLFEPLGLDAVQGGGQGTTEENAPLHYEDGGAVAVQLIRGDVNASGLGTVTRVEGDRLVAFGHPMMNGGVTALPTAIGRVLWLLASESASFKLGMAVRPLGALVNDRQASIVVSESAVAPIIPVSLRINGVPGAPHKDWNFEVAHEKFMTPSFLAMALGNAMQATGADRQDVSWRAESRVKVKGHPEVLLEDFGVAIGGTPDPREFVRSHVVSSVGGILNNPWEPALIESVDTTIWVNYARNIVRLRGARALENEVKAGGVAHVELTLIPFAGKVFTKVISVPIPRHLSGQKLKLSIRPGHSVAREKADPDSLSSFIANLEQPVYPPKGVVIAYAAGGGVAYKGRVIHNLPAGALDSITQRNTSIAPHPFKSMRRHVVQLQDFMLGSDTVTVQVKALLR